MALVPPPLPRNTSIAPSHIFGDAEAGDSFYPWLLSIAEKVNGKMIAVEVGDMAQAERVAAMVVKGKGWGRCEIWRDGVLERDGKHGLKELGGKNVAVRGEGNGRVVVAWR